VERSHHGAGEIMVLPLAARVTARDEEQRGRAIDHDASRVPVAFDDASPILDAQLEVDQASDFVAEPRCFVFALSTIGEALRLGAITSGVHHRRRM
jgi:hypothetical protein